MVYVPEALAGLVRRKVMALSARPVPAARYPLAVVVRSQVTSACPLKMGGGLGKSPKSASNVDRKSQRWGRPGTSSSANDLHRTARTPLRLMSCSHNTPSPLAAFAGVMAQIHMLEIK
jgi:hypothetical protein